MPCTWSVGCVSCSRGDDDTALVLPLFLGKYSSHARCCQDGGWRTETVHTRVDHLGSANGLFVTANGLDMFLQGGKASTHRVDGDMPGAQVVPLLRLVPPLVGVTIPCIHLRLDAHGAWIATGLPHVAVQALDGLLHLLVRSTQREPAVRQPRSTAQ